MSFPRCGVRAAVIVCAALACGSALEAQSVSFEQTVADLSNRDRDARLRATRDLKESAFPEAALSLARAVLDSDDGVQHEAIMGELNAFLADRVVPRKRVGLVVEVRNRISAQTIFESGSRAIDPRPVPSEVLTALRSASHDDNPQIALEALYAFGALADNAYGPARRSLLSASAPELAAALGVPQVEIRATAMRVIGRLYAWRTGDLAVDQTVGDAVVTALNDGDAAVRTPAIDVLGLLRYERGVQALTDIYQHYERGANAAAALGALAWIGHPSSLPLFLSALSSRDPSLRASAIEGVGRLGAVDQLPTITALLAKERNEDALLAGHFAAVLLSNGAMDELVGGLTRPKLRPMALRYLIDATPTRVRIVGPHLPDPQPALRADLLDVLGLSGDQDAAALALQMREDTDPGVARAAARALARLQGVEALGVLERRRPQGQ